MQYNIEVPGSPYCTTKNGDHRMKPFNSPGSRTLSRQIKKQLFKHSYSTHLHPEEFSATIHKTDMVHLFQL
jgi:hypothetical protein